MHQRFRVPSASPSAQVDLSWVNFSCGRLAHRSTLRLAGASPLLQASNSPPLQLQSLVESPPWPLLSFGHVAAQQHGSCSANFLFPTTSNLAHTKKERAYAAPKDPRPLTQRARVLLFLELSQRLRERELHTLRQKTSLTTQLIRNRRHSSAFISVSAYRRTVPFVRRVRGKCSRYVFRNAPLVYLARKKQHLSTCQKHTPWIDSSS